ncbi:MAG: RNA-binding protein [Tissierellia bacterium]|nr:RNA-binding protein [Tissierellia bacterium]
MIELGKINKLKVLRFKNIGAYLNVEEGGDPDDDILLPKKEIASSVQVGDELEALVYRDSKDRIIATLRRPLLQVGEMGFLTMVQKTKIGYFMDWGLEKDVLLPFSESIGHLETGRKYLVRLYVDKSDRICATMKIKESLQANDSYKEDDIVEGVIYLIHRELGAFVAVDMKYDALLPNDEMFGVFEIGDKMSFRVSRIREDGKLTLSLRDRSHIEMPKDQEKIMEKLKKNKGFLPLNDNSPPELIREYLNMSKAGFKRAIGGLYKQRLIIIDDLGIELREDKNAKKH